ncbi:hypothetical protein BIFBRE_05117, partial [Bifidobacterium breve DSM 20213 = JCM 1192]
DSSHYVAANVDTSVAADVDADVADDVDTNVAADVAAYVDDTWLPTWMTCSCLRG